MFVYFKMNITVSVQNSISLVKYFKLKFQMVHSLGSSQKISLYLARLFTGLICSLCVFTIRTDHSNACSLGKYFQMEVSMEIICRYPNRLLTWKPRGFHGHHAISKNTYFLLSWFEVSNWNSPQLVHMETVHISWKPCGFPGNLVTT